MIPSHRRMVFVLAVSLAVSAQVRASWFLRGDANGSGAVDVSDAIVVLGYLFEGGPLSCLDAADANDDGTLEIADPIHLLRYLFLGGLPPVTPIRNCWPDLTGGRLGCESSPLCQPAGIFFVCHKGGSMNNASIWKELQNEVIALIETLSDADEFGLAYFDSNLMRFPASGKPAQATAEMKAAAINRVKTTFPGQGSCALPAFMAAFDFIEQSTAKSLQIQYISNGWNTCPGGPTAEYEATMLSRIDGRNVKKVPINAVALGLAGGVNEDWMKKVASSSGGAYIRVIPR